MPAAELLTVKILILDARAPWWREQMPAWVAAGKARYHGEHYVSFRRVDPFVPPDPSATRPPRPPATPAELAALRHVRKLKVLGDRLTRMILASPEQVAQRKEACQGCNQYRSDEHGQRCMDCGCAGKDLKNALQRTDHRFCERGRWRGLQLSEIRPAG